MTRDHNTNIFPLLTKEEADVLHLMAEQVFAADMYPPSLKRYLPRVIDDGGKDKIVKSFYADGTKAAILATMFTDVMCSLDPINAMQDRKKRETDKKGKPENAASDPHTEKELEKRGAAQEPDFNTLKSPVMADVLRKKPPVEGTLQVTITTPRIEGEIWVDENQRWWKIVDGKKKQQKKPKH